MIEFPLGESALRAISEFRTEYLTSFLQFFTFLGEDEGYILIITFIYIVYDKQLAIRLAFIVLITMAFNHLLKMLIGNPRPFVKDGSFMRNWMISPEYANELATEFSTPSGHAMSAFTFYGYLHQVFKNIYFKIGVVSTILFIGISRPYLGVHYIEDIALGWLIGLMIVVLVMKHSKTIAKFWQRLNLKKKLGYTVGSSVFLWLATLLINDMDVSSLPMPFIGHLGFILGVMIGHHLEGKHLNFNPKSKNLTSKMVRWLLTVMMVMAPLIFLDEIALNWFKQSIPTHLLHYVCYTLSGFLGIYVAPALFLKLNLLERIKV